MPDMALQYPPLQVGAGRRLGVGWWGVLGLIATEGALFIYLLFSYAYTALQNDPSWMPEQPSLKLSLPNTGLLLLSSVAVWWGERANRNGQRAQVSLGVGIAILLGVAFAAIQVLEWHNKPFTLRSGVYGSLYFTITGFHMAHVVVGIAALIALLCFSLLGYLGPARNAPLVAVAAYWHFVDAVWLVVFSTLYLSPLLLG
jgi:cytochrome c oxidase subunit 3